MSNAMTPELCFKTIPRILTFKHVNFDKPGQQFIERDLSTRVPSGGVLQLEFFHCTIPDLDWFIGYFFKGSGIFKDTLAYVHVCNAFLACEPDWYKAVAAMATVSNLIECRIDQITLEPHIGCTPEHGARCKETIYPKPLFIQGTSDVVRRELLLEVDRIKKSVEDLQKAVCRDVVRANTIVLAPHTVGHIDVHDIGKPMAEFSPATNTLVLQNVLVNTTAVALLMTDILNSGHSVMSVYFRGCRFNNIEWVIQRILGGDDSGVLPIKDTLQHCSFSMATLRQGSGWHKVLEHLSKMPHLTRCYISRLAIVFESAHDGYRYGLLNGHALNLMGPGLHSRLEDEAAKMKKQVHDFEEQL